MEGRRLLQPELNSRRRGRPEQETPLESWRGPGLSFGEPRPLQCTRPRIFPSFFARPFASRPRGVARGLGRCDHEHPRWGGRTPFCHNPPCSAHRFLSYGRGPPTDSGLYRALGRPAAFRLSSVSSSAGRGLSDSGPSLCPWSMGLFPTWEPRSCDSCYDRVLAPTTRTHEGRAGGQAILPVRADARTVGRVLVGRRALPMGLLRSRKNERILCRAGRELPRVW